MIWLTISVLFVLTAGFAKLSTAVLNRYLATPRSRRATVVFELIQLLSLPLYPAVLAYSLGGRAADLGQFHWQSFTPGEWVLVVLGVIGFLFLIRSTLIFQLYKPPRCEVSAESRIIDFRKQAVTSSVGSQGVTDKKTWRQTLVGPKPMRRIALLPGNQQFSLQVSTKTYSLPRFPVEWDGLSILQIADTHFRGGVQRAYFEAVCAEAQALKPDLIVFSGDLLDDPALLEWLPETLGRLQAPFGQYFVLGNHDWQLGTDGIRTGFQQQGWIDLSSRCVELRGPASGPPLILAGDETPWMGTHPDLSQVGCDLFRILLSHTPDNITWARKQGIDLMFAGHTHGGQIRLPVLGPVYSPSRFGCRYASGVFWLDPTLLYVSRGISGREPIRYNCIPELTKLVLKNGQPR